MLYLYISYCPSSTIKDNTADFHVETGKIFFFSNINKPKLTSSQLIKYIFTNFHTSF